MFFLRDGQETIQRVDEELVSTFFSNPCVNKEKYIFQKGNDFIDKLILIKTPGKSS